MTDNELLLAISSMLDIKLDSKLRAELQPLKDDIRDIKLHIENCTDKNIQLLAENYVPAAKRYEKSSAQLEAIQADIEFSAPVVPWVAIVLAVNWLKVQEVSPELSPFEVRNSTLRVCVPTAL